MKDIRFKLLNEHPIPVVDNEDLEPVFEFEDREYRIEDMCGVDVIGRTTDGIWKRFYYTIESGRYYVEHYEVGLNEWVNVYEMIEKEI